MGTRRLAYVVTLACSFLFFALYPFWFSWYLLVLILLVVPFDLLISIPGMVTKRITLSAPIILEKGSGGKLVVTTYQEKSFPAGRIKASLASVGDDFALKQRLVCNPDGGSRKDIGIDTSHCGVIVFEIKRIKLTSLVGLFSLSVTVGCRATVLVIPAPIKPPHIISLPRGVILRPKPGGGFSEDHELRQYRIGDPIRVIHWKLSAKHDSLIIREPLLPPPHSRLVHLAKWSGPHERDVIIGRLRWISDYLLRWDLPYCVRIGDDGPVAEITSEGDLIKYFYSILDKSASPMPHPVSLPARFSWVFRVNAKEEEAK